MESIVCHSFVSSKFNFINIKNYVHAEFEGTLSLNMQATVKVTFNYKRWYTEWNEVEHKLDTIDNRDYSIFNK